MNLSKLETFAQKARKDLLLQVSTQLDAVLAPQSLARRASPRAVQQLEEEIARETKAHVVDRVAYTWFNRFCALRFMDANGYNRVRVLSPADGFVQPELLAEAKQGLLPAHLDAALQAQVTGLLQGRVSSPAPEQEAYRILLVAECNALHKTMPFLFETINDASDLLLPADLLSATSVPAAILEVLDSDTCQQVEVIGWLYQFYISEEKDRVMNAKAAVKPDEIPAVTQLFTPRWIVAYLVENSLGRLWLQSRPQSGLRAQMRYYLDEAEPVQGAVLKVQRPEEIRLLDPACGSGHILVYAFELLVQIYREEGYDDAEIPGLILQHNLVGFDIDDRAAELASFALLMQARKISRRFLQSPVQPMVQALKAPQLDASELQNYLQKVGRDLFSASLLDSLQQLEDAPHFGSLIRPICSDVQGLVETLESKGVKEDLLFGETHRKIRLALDQLALLGGKYHCVVANPPYMGSGKMNGDLKEFVKREYENAKADLCVCFIERGFGWLRPQGFNAMVTMHSWMFLSSFEEFRKHWIANRRLVNLNHLGARAFDGIGGEVVQTAAFVWENREPANSLGNYVRLVDSEPGSAQKEALFLSGEKRFHARQSDFAKIPGSPIAYWVSEKFFCLFNSSAYSNYGQSPGRFKTHDDSKYVRNLWEISRNTNRWKMYNKGGESRKWYGNYSFAFDWSKEALSFYESHGGLSRKELWNKEGVCWSGVTAGINSFRYKRADSEVSSGSPTIILNNPNQISEMLRSLNSSISHSLIEVVNPTVNLNVGDVINLPFLNASVQVSHFGSSEIVLAKLDWDSFETSWDFPGHSLLSTGNWSTQPNGRLRISGEADAENPNSIDLSVQWPALKGKDLAESYANWRQFAEQQTAELKRLEEENNRLFIDAYGLQGELSPDVPFKEITLTVNPVYRYGEGKSTEEYDALLRADAAKELISYAIGCMFGRYSLDRPGLVLASQGEGFADYCTKVFGSTAAPAGHFLPDEDNVIPVLDEDWFPDDLFERLRTWLKAAYSPETLEDNIRWLESALGKDLRKYLVKDFYNDHVRTYRKRPIYWMFSSPSGSFNALIYLHRYHPDQVSVVLNDYLREYRTKLAARKKHLDDLAIHPDASQRDKTKAIKDSDKLRKVIQEIDDYDRDVLYPLATKRIDLDLDDGVKVNYQKLGAGLRKIAGMEKED